MESLTLKLKLFTCADPELLIRKGGGVEEWLLQGIILILKLRPGRGEGLKPIFINYTL